MAGYREKWWQLGRKKLPFEVDIIKKINSSMVSLEEYINLGMHDYGIDESCIVERERQIVQKFGFEKLKNLDLDLILILGSHNYDYIQLLLSMDSNTEHVNMALYEAVKDILKPMEYSSTMKVVYSDRLFELPDKEDETYQIKRDFNDGTVSLTRLIDNWPLFESKDLSVCLRNDSYNKVGITDDELKKFMREDMPNHRDLYDMIIEYRQNGYKRPEKKYEFVHQIATASSKDEQRKVAQKFLNEEVLGRTNIAEFRNFGEDKLRKIFKYFNVDSIVDWIEKTYVGQESLCRNLTFEMEVDLKEEYIHNSAPLFIGRALVYRDVMRVLNTFGLKNVIDFDNENDHFFTGNDCYMLINFIDLFKDPERYESQINTSGVERVYTKEEFYKAMRITILHGNRKVPGYEKIKGEFRKSNPDLFIAEEAPEELRRAANERTLTPNLILKLASEDPKNIEFLRGKKFGILCEPGHEVFEFLEEKMDFDKRMSFILEYHDALSSFMALNLSPEVTNAEVFKRKLGDFYINHLLESGRPYPDDIPVDIKNRHKTAFLDENNPNVPKELKEKFKTRTLTVIDFEEHPDWLNYFSNTNIAYGFSKEFSWVAEVHDSRDIQNSNRKCLRIIEEYAKIPDEKSKEIFRKYFFEHGNKIKEGKIKYVSELLIRLYYSNSVEMSSFRESFAYHLLETDNPIENCKKVEKIFLENKLPLFAKMFLTFQTIYPDLDKVEVFKFDDASRVAPELKDMSLPNIGFHSSSNDARMIIIFNDLLRIAYRSNEKSFVDYLDSLEKGNKIFSEIRNSEDLNKLQAEQKEILETFVNQLEVLYQNTTLGNKNEVGFSKLQLEEKIKFFQQVFRTDGPDLKDRIVTLFCFNAGIRTFDELKQLTIGAKTEQAERVDRTLREIEQNGGKFKFQEGDFVRCIGNYDIFGSTLAAGNVCKEHLGSFTGTIDHDTTPLDVDLSLITETRDIFHAIDGTPTGWGFGNIFVVFKKDNPNLNVTRDQDGNLTGSKYDPRKLETFGSRSLINKDGYYTHWGIRTGFAFTDIDVIILDGDEALPILKFEIAKNGYYIPIVDLEGKLVFTKTEFADLRSKMQGLSYYGENDYKLSESVDTPETLKVADEITDATIKETEAKRSKICNVVSKVLGEFGLQTRYNMSNDLISGTAELIDTGSTGRNTNIPHEGDFDFFMRLDAEIMRNPEKLNQLRNRIIEAISLFPMKELVNITDKGDLRFKGVTIDEKTEVDIDISFGVKTDKVRYSSDQCLKDRLDTIQREHPEEYKNVVANIILAKRILKKADVYKSSRSDKSQGGLGGIGIENWILQNGGSFIEAAKSFLEAANGRSFDEFKGVYQIWNFGDNHFAARDGDYLHNNFIADSMNEIGYNKMVTALKEYLNSLEQEHTYDSTAKI